MDSVVVMLVLCVLQKSVRRIVSSALCVCWTTDGLAAPANPSDATAPTPLCAAKTAIRTPTTARGGAPNAWLRPTSPSSNKDRVVSRYQRMSYLLRSCPAVLIRDMKLRHDASFMCVTPRQCQSIISPLTHPSYSSGFRSF